MHEKNQNRIRLILVGGFLGAGKTTLLIRAAKQLAAAGHRVGLVTNDQGADLVDTALATRQQIPVTEVAGGCFCCRFPDLLQAFQRLRETVNPTVILAEPVGSCTDLMATVLLPLQRYYPELYEIAPLTVMLDATRDPGKFSATVNYLYRKQLDEAEIIALNKIDLLPPDRVTALVNDLSAAHTQSDDVEVMVLSAHTGDGIPDWLTTALSHSGRLARVLELDYQQYAEAEAHLGWLNAKAAIRAGQAFAANDWLTDLLQSLQSAFIAQDSEIAHIKAQLISPTVHLKASVTQRDKPIYWDMWSPHAETDRGQLLLNARVHSDPQRLEETIRRVLATVRPQPDFRCDFIHFECFKPAPPQPTHRLSAA